MKDNLLPHTQRIIEAEIEKSRNAGLEGPKKYISIRDQQALLNIDPRDVLTGKVEVSDD